ncbi:MAG TPA: 50S ribosomal protein L32 [Clostridia bacterium]|nr:50S ribosomal protein L32 [Clostridia bacterium]
MALPKRRHSKARSAKRKATWLRRPAPSVVECPKCHEPKLNHRVCPSCGYYRDREVISESE